MGYYNTILPKNLVQFVLICQHHALCFRHSAVTFSVFMLHSVTLLFSGSVLRLIKKQTYDILKVARPSSTMSARHDPSQPPPPKLSTQFTVVTLKLTSVIFHSATVLIDNRAGRWIEL